MRAFYQGWEIRQTPSATFEARVTGSLFSSHSGLEKAQTPSALSWPTSALPLEVFPLPWSHYIRLLAVEDVDARVLRVRGNSWRLVSTATRPPG